MQAAVSGVGEAGGGVSADGDVGPAGSSGGRASSTRAVEHPVSALLEPEGRAAGAWASAGGAEVDLPPPDADLRPEGLEEVRPMAAGEEIGRWREGEGGEERAAGAEEALAGAAAGFGGRPPLEQPAQRKPDLQTHPESAGMRRLGREAGRWREGWEAVEVAGGGVGLEAARGAANPRSPTVSPQFQPSVESSSN